jgi:ABC-type glycerol-3-phosphate transport system substrate-binding protein
MRKLAVLAAAALVLWASGCSRQGGSPSAAAPGGGPVTVNFYAHSDNEAIVAAQVEQFNAANPGIRVVQHIIPNDDYDDKIKVLIAGTSGEIDALWIRTPAQAQQFIANKVLADLGPYAAESGLDLEPIWNTALLGITANGAFYGYPTTGSCWMLFYNKTYFDQNHIPYPDHLTWDQYMDLAKGLAHTEGTRKIWGGAIPPWTMNLGSSPAGEYLTAPDPMPLTRRYAEALHRMYVEDKSHPGIAGMSVGTFNISSLFTSGDTLMLVMGDWAFLSLDTPFEYAVSPLPVFPEAAQGASVGQPSFYSVTRNSPHPAEAYKFIEFCTTSAGGTSIYASFKGVPSYPTESAMEIYKEQLKVPGIDFRFSARVAPEQGNEPYYAAVNDAFREELQLYLLDEQSLDKTFSNFYALRKEIVDSYR